MVFSYQLLEVCTARNLQAIAPVPLVAGDSMYIGIPWTESIKKESLESRASLVARRLYHGQLLHAITFAKAGEGHRTESVVGGGRRCST